MPTTERITPAIGPRRLRRRMTEEQYVAWASRSTRRSEWVNGEVLLMQAAEFGHVDWVFYLIELGRRFVRANQWGIVIGEPYQVRLPSQETRRQPDLYFVPAAKRHLLQRMQFAGVPDLIVEVVSPGSRTEDREVKFAEYESAGVPEYWLPDPVQRTFEAYTLGDGGRYTRAAEVDGAVYSTTLPGLFFRPAWLRLFEPPDPDPLLAEMAAERHRRLGGQP